MILGLDLGGSFTKVVAILDNGEKKYTYFPTKIEEIKKFFVIDENNDLFVPEFGQKVTKWAVTGGGAYKFHDFFDNLTPKPKFLDELGIQALGAQQLIADSVHLHTYGAEYKKEDRFLVVSMGTGCSFTLIAPGQDRKHVGGSAIGGGTLMGLAKLLLNVTSFKELVELGSKGDYNAYHLLVSDIYGSSYGSTLKSNVTASSFAKAAVGEVSGSREDIAACLISMICYSLGQQVASVAVGNKTSTIVFVGGFLSEEGIIPDDLARAATLFEPSVTLVVPDNHRYAGAYGAALSA